MGDGWKHESIGVYINGNYHATVTLQQYSTLGKSYNNNKIIISKEKMTPWTNVCGEEHVIMADWGSW